MAYLKGGTIVGGDLTVAESLYANSLSIYGNIVVNGYVDGRDISTDGSKLDSIENNANYITNNNQLTNGAGYITSSGSITGSAGSVTNSISFNNGGSGAGSGSTFNGSGTITVSYNTIGAAASSHTHSYLPLGGGTLTGDLTLQYAFPRINLTDTDNNSDYSIINSNGTFGIFDSTNSSYRLIINSSGYVGIGISPGTTPTHKLQVSGSIYASSDVYAYSDQSVKTNLEVISNSIEKIKQINGYTFNRIDFESDKRYAGVIAQEVEKILPEVINMNEDGTKSVAYGNIVALLIEAIKEQQVEIDELKSKIL